MEMKDLGQTAYVVAETDTVATALNTLYPGRVVLRGARTEAVTIKETIPFGHKFALCDMKEGDSIIKYRFPIAIAACAIQKGMYVHTHNAKSTMDLRSNSRIFKDTTFGQSEFGQKEGDAP